MSAFLVLMLLLITFTNSFLYQKTLLLNKAIKRTFYGNKLYLHSTEGEDTFNTKGENEIDLENNKEIPEYEEEIIPNELVELMDTNYNVTVDNATTTFVIDPLEKAIKDYENKLSTQLSLLESTLKNEKLNLLRVKDRISETGKNGFFIVQAQVNDFSRKKENDQKQRVKSNKREFIEKMLPVVDLFREAPNKVPALNEKEETMHKTYGALLDNILAVFQKYGYKEFDGDVGTKLDPLKHQIAELQETNELESGVIIETIRRGISDGEGDILRRALVIASKAPVLLSEDSDFIISDEDNNDVVINDEDNASTTTDIDENE